VGTLLLNEFKGLKSFLAFVPTFPLKNSHTPKEVRLHVCLELQSVPTFPLRMAVPTVSGNFFINKFKGLQAFFAFVPAFPLKKSHIPKKVA
jgi:hypothetical protein